MNVSEMFTSRLEEFKALWAKRDVSKGESQGWTAKQYNRISSLHSFLLSSEKGKKELKELGFS